MHQAPLIPNQHQYRVGQGVVSFASGLDHNHASLLRSIASFATRSATPGVLRVNLPFVCEQLGKNLGEVITLLGDLKETQVSVRTAHGHEYCGLVKGAVPVDNGRIWDIHLGDAGAWLLDKSRTSCW